jgi:hypothetical protein
MIIVFMGIYGRLAPLLQPLDSEAAVGSEA